MKCLAFDTSAGACAAAVSVEGRDAAQRTVPMARGHTEALIPMLQAVMAEAGLGFGDLDLIGVTVGPGAFTGIRIGLATARGLALAAGVPVAGVTSLMALAGSLPDAPDRPVLALMDTKRGDAYAQLFAADLSAIGPPAVAAAGDLATLLGDRPALIVGDVSDDLVAPLLAHSGVRRGGVRNVDPGRLAALAVSAWRDDRALPPDPLYLRPPEATLPTRRGLRP